jgi:hypothetical protein
MNLTKKQERWIKELEGLWNFFHERLKDYSLETGDLRFGLLLNMTVMVHRLIRGFLAQLQGGSNDFLESRLRAMLEADITITYILADETGNRARAFILDAKRSRLRVLTRLLRLLEQKKAPAMEEVNTIESYKQLKQSLEQELLGKEHMRWPNLELRAKAVNAEESYATVIWSFSEETHMTAEALNRYLRNIEGGIGVLVGLDLGELDQQVQTAYISYLAFLNTCSQQLGFPTYEELQSFNSSDMIPSPPHLIS